MFLCYFDDSGDAGVPSATLHSPTNWFILNCVLVYETNWLQTLDELVNLRRTLRDDYGLPPRDELNGIHFRSGKGIFRDRGIGRAKRMEIYHFIMNFESSLPIKTFSVAIQKEQAAKKGWNPRYCAWTFALQRLDKMCSKEDDRCTIFPDEGHSGFIRQRIRSMRRYHSVPKHYDPGTFRLPISRVLEDPNERKSHESYFIQLADLNAYASHRSGYIEPVRKMDKNIWDSLSTPLDDVRLLEVNAVRDPKGPPAIVKYP